MTRQCITHHYACDCREVKFAEMERDALRYRWVKDNAVLQDSAFGISFSCPLRFSVVTRSGFDAHIDAAMQKEGEG